MTSLQKFLLILCAALLPMAAMAQNKLVRIYAPPELVDSGLIKHILPRFSLKTQVKTELVDDPNEADISLGAEGEALFHGLGQTWRMRLRDTDHAHGQKLAGWLASKVGQNTVMGYAPDGDTLFVPPPTEQLPTVAIEMDGDAQLGHAVSRAKCGRCHQVDSETGMTGIGSTPSFAVLRSLPDWTERFTAFYAVNPHPAFTQIADVTLPFPDDRPSPIVPIEMTIDEVEAVLAYVAALPAAELGRPLVQQ